MAANRTVTSLSIALIIFVMLTFVLAIMLYVVFGQRLDEEKKAVDAFAEAQKARTELNAAQDEKRKLQELIGVGAEKTVPEVEAETGERIAKDFAGFNEDPKTLLKLVTWLADAVAAKDRQLDQLRQDKDKTSAEQTTALTAEKASTGQKEAERERVEKELAELKRRFADDRVKFQEQQDRLTAERQKALDEVTTFERLRTDVESVRQALPPALHKKFDAAAEPEQKLKVLSDSLKELQKVVRDQNALLAKLNAADPAVQKAVSTAAPKDERIERFDGNVLSVNEADRSVVLSFASTAGMRPGLLFDVFDRAEARPLVGGGKGVIEIVAVEGRTRARGRIRRDSPRTPILAGDSLATGLWSPGSELEVVIVGYVQLDGDRDTDVDELVSRIESFGGTVVDSVSASTDLIVDGGLPRSVTGESKTLPGWRPVDASRRSKQLDFARNLGIRTVTVDGMLEMLGETRQEVETGSLPRRSLDRAASPR